MADATLNDVVDMLKKINRNIKLRDIAPDKLTDE